MKIEELIEKLDEAKTKGAISNWTRRVSLDLTDPCREFYIVSPTGDEYTIIWYCNVMTLKQNAFELWFHDINVNGFHPSYQIAMVLITYDRAVAHIGSRN